MLIACHAWEGMYQGLHGIEDKIVIEAKDLKDARNQVNEWGNIASEELIYSYGFEDDYLSDFDEDANDEDLDITESCYYYDRGWCGFVIKEGKFTSLKEAEEELSHNDFDYFVKNYCEEEELN